MNSSQVLNYFDAAADCYQSRTESFPWKLVRKLESQAVLEHLPSLEGLTVLDACCGNGFYTRLLAAGGASQITAVDLSEKMLAEIKMPGINLVQGDLCQLDPKEEFDLILCAGGLEFMENPQMFFSWTAKHARRGAVMLLLTPPKSVAGFIYRTYHLIHGLNISLFPRRELLELVASAGWKLVSLERIHPYAQLLVTKLEK